MHISHFGTSNIYEKVVQLYNPYVMLEILDFMEENNYPIIKDNSDTIWFKEDVERVLSSFEQAS